MNTSKELSALKTDSELQSEPLLSHTPKSLENNHHTVYHEISHNPLRPSVFQTIFSQRSPSTNLLVSNQYSQPYQSTSLINSHTDSKEISNGLEEDTEIKSFGEGYTARRNIRALHHSWTRGPSVANTALHLHRINTNDHTGRKENTIL